jgi:tetratricopeptide (TPR) repeat protein
MKYAVSMAPGLLRRAVIPILVIVAIAPSSLGAQGPATPDLAAARQLFRQGDFKGAAAAFRKMIEHDPTPQAWAGLVQSLLKLDDVKSAAESSQKGLEEFPQAALVHASRGDVEFRRGLMSKAAEEYRTALKIDPSCARAWLGQGKLDAVMARRTRSKEEIAKAHELDPEDGDALYEWAIRQAYPANIAGLEKHLAEFRNDAETERHERDHLELLKALAGRNVWILRPEVTRSELKIEPMLVGTQLTRRGFGMRVGFNGRAFATLLVDTGASGVTISRKFAEKIGARKLSDQEIEGVGRGGGVHAYTAWVDKVTIGDLEFHDCFVHVTPQPIPETDGMIGTDIFQNFLVTLDFPGHKLRLEPLPPAAASGDDPPAQAQRLSQAIAFGHLLLLETRTSDKTSGLFVLDTGSNINTVSPELSKRIEQMRPFNFSGQGMSGFANISSVAENVSLEFAQIRCRGQRLFTVDLHSISKDLGTELSGQIGFSALQEGSVVINYRDGLVGFFGAK